MTDTEPKEPAGELPIQAMEAKSVAALPSGEGWQFEPKWDGFRCLAFKSGDEVVLYTKSGKPLARYFPDIADAVRALPGTDFVLDGELVIRVDGILSFDALQMRLHPAASRVAKLVAWAPAQFILFDMLTEPGGRITLGDPLTERRKALEAFLAEAGPNPTIKLSPFTRDRNEALRWLEGAGGEMDGVIAKRADGPYVSGERAMLKIKRTRTADCVVGGFRYGTGSPDMGSLLLGLFNDEGQLDHVGHCSSFSVAERHELTPKLEALRGEPGFTGRSPGGPSRWSTERTGEFESLRHELVVEVSYDHMSSGRFRHGTTFIRWRPDKAPAQCRFDQLEQVIAPEFLRT